ncbi:hypothetical protein CC86DRAFT_403433 [Ophiobolus disseminans]|uniref:Uncharacterized protein n=1 Tax=Ophiobolus disseminans TaxID=1469910 RepID=A0A6A7AA94_9PLEO|nr:hypothetical protein CC86DRAFT_403433 [Ophiobolus disseminans]
MSGCQLHSQPAPQAQQRAPMSGSHSQHARSVMQHGHPQGSHPYLSHPFGGEGSHRPGPLRHHTADEPQPRSNSHVGVATTAHSARPRLVEVTQSTQSRSNRLVGDEATDRLDSPRAPSPDLIEPDLNCVVKVATTAQVGRPQVVHVTVHLRSNLQVGDAIVTGSSRPRTRDHDTTEPYTDRRVRNVASAQLGRPFVRTVDDTIPRSRRRAGAASLSSSLPPTTENYSHLLYDYHDDGLNRNVVQVPTHELSSALPRRRSPSEDYAEGYRALIVPEPLSSSLRDAIREVYSPNTQSQFPFPIIPSRHDSTTSHITHDLGIVSVNVGSTSWAVNSSPTSSGVDPRAAQPNRDSTASYVLHDRGTLTTLITPQVVNISPTSSITSDVELDCGEVSTPPNSNLRIVNQSTPTSSLRDSILLPYTPEQIDQLQELAKYTWRNRNRDSVLSIHSVFGRGSRRTMQLYCGPFDPFTIWLREVFVDFASEED